THGRRGGYWRWSRKEVEVGDCALTTSRGTRDCPHVPKKAGYYIVRASAKDDAGNLTRASSGFWVWGGAASWGEQSGIEIVADQALYHPGETATLLVKSPFKSARGVLTIARGGILEHRPLDLASNAEAITVPIAAS